MLFARYWAHSRGRIIGDCTQGFNIDAKKQSLAQMLAQWRVGNINSLAGFRLLSAALLVIKARY